MQSEIQKVTIMHTIVCGDLPEAGIKEHQRLYLAWDQQARRLFVVQWDRVRWMCSCGKARCIHRLAANTYLFELSSQREA
jgi:hypothetical protein